MNRRAFMASAGAAVMAGATNFAQGSPPLGTHAQIDAGVLSIGYFELGRREGPPVVLLHGWPYDVHSYIEVAPELARRGCRVIVPYLRGHGTTRFLSQDTLRSGQQSAMGSDVLALLDALQIECAVLAGYDWGGRAACVAAALWPHRCTGLVSVNGYLIQDIARSALPLDAEVEAAFWYQFYFLTERGRAGLAQHRREIAHLMWTRNSPSWRFDAPTFERSAAAFENPDYVDVVIHSYRHRLGQAAGEPRYFELERRLASQPVITVPAITLDGEADGVVRSNDGTRDAARFSARRDHRVIPKAGHNLPQEAPEAFVAAVLDLMEHT